MLHSGSFGPCHILWLVDELAEILQSVDTMLEFLFLSCPGLACRSFILYMLLMLLLAAAVCFVAAVEEDTTIASPYVFS